jgi:hypothetical protein
MRFTSSRPALDQLDAAELEREVHRRAELVAGELTALPAFPRAPWWGTSRGPSASELVEWAAVAPRDMRPAHVMLP